MVPYCTSCDVLAKAVETEPVDTLDECKSKCLKDPDCLAMEFGKKGEAREGECWLNRDNGLFVKSSSLDAWIKTTVCGNWLFFAATKFEYIIIKRYRQNLLTMLIIFEEN